MSLRDLILQNSPYSKENIKSIIRQLLHAIGEVHNSGIIHRDIKPDNVVIDSKNFKTCLIDFGLSEFYFPDKEYNTRIATRPFKPIEILVNYQKYFQSFDIWGIGNILGCLVSKLSGKLPIRKSNINF
jgi:casein kinase II subunit alpha